MEKFKKYKEIFIVAVVILGLAFYWFQLRPTMIKKECSWFTQVISADAGITKEQADAMRKESLEQCGKRSTGMPCLLDKYSEERDPQPGKQITRDATKSEYDACLRRNGLL